MRKIQFLHLMLFLLLLASVSVLCKTEAGKEEKKKSEEASKKKEETANTKIECDFVEKLDHYERLGVSRDANDKEIKRAYRKLSLKYHPDKNTGPNKDCAQKHFIATAKAYEILSDEQKRKQYDTFGDMENMESGQAGFEGFEGFDPFNVFQQFFNRQASGTRGGSFHASSGPQHQQFFFFDEGPNDFDMADCINYCILQYRQAGYVGDLEAQCQHECMDQMNQGQGPVFDGFQQMFQEDPFQNAYGQQYHYINEQPYYMEQTFDPFDFVQDDGGGFQGQRANTRANILEHMMRGGSTTGPQRGRGPQVMYEDPYGNHMWQDTFYDEHPGFEYAQEFPGPGGRGSASSGKRNRRNRDMYDEF